MARNFVESGTFAIRDSSSSAWTYGPLYPLLISPAVLAGDAPTALALVKGINAMLFSLAAVPAYALGRRILARGPAIAAAALALLVPSAVYTTRVMTESAAYPIFLLAMLAMFDALERPTNRRQLIAFAAMLLAVAVRAQMVAFVPAFALSVVLLAVHGRVSLVVHSPSG